MYYLKPFKVLAVIVRNQVFPCLSAREAKAFLLKTFSYLGIYLLCVSMLARMCVYVCPVCGGQRTASTMLEMKLRLSELATATFTPGPSCWPCCAFEQLVLDHVVGRVVVPLKTTTDSSDDLGHLTQSPQQQYLQVLSLPCLGLNPAAAQSPGLLAGEMGAWETGPVETLGLYAIPCILRSSGKQTTCLNCQLSRA